MGADFSLFTKRICRIPCEADVEVKGALERQQAFRYIIIRVQEQEKK